MSRNRVLVAVVAALGCAVAATPDAAAYAPREKTYTAGGIEYMVGHTDLAARPVTALNGALTNREAFLDNTTYGRFAGEGKGTLRAGYLVACQFDLDAELGLDAEVGADAGADAGIDIDLDGVEPGLDLSIGPEVSGSAGLSFSLTPGEIADIEVGEKELQPGTTGYYYTRDAHIDVANCGGPLTIRGYSIIEIDTPEVGASGAVFTDPITL
jgi:hypothetical protein